jgi:hypothetical protein
LEWINHADLFRVRSIGSDYADLLEAAGVDTLPDLRQRNADALCAMLVTTNEEKRLVRKMPTVWQVHAGGGAGESTAEGNRILGSCLAGSSIKSEVTENFNHRRRKK